MRRRRRHKIEVDETICTNTGTRVIRIIIPKVAIPKVSTHPGVVL